MLHHEQVIYCFENLLSFPPFQKNINSEKKCVENQSFVYLHNTYAIKLISISLKLHNT